MLQVSPADPITLHDLDPAEHLLVFGLRAIAVGHGDCPTLAQTFIKRCGPMGTLALQAYFTLVRLIGMSSRRRLQVHVPGCACVSVDETAVLGIVAAAQEAVDGGDDTLLRMRLGFLTRADAGEVLRHTAQALARALSAGGQALPVRIEATPAAARPQLSTVH